MSSTIANSSNMETNPATKPSAEATDPQKFKVVTHMKQYPLAVAAKNEALKIPYMGLVLSTVDSASQAMRNAYGIGYVCNTSDQLMDALLNQIDSLVPALKTIKAEAIAAPLSGPMVVIATEAQLVAHATQATVNEHITKPTVKLSNDVKVIVKTMIYNSEGKNRVLTPIDPIVAYLNNGMENIGARLSPGLVKVPTENQSSELSRTLKIIQNLVRRNKEAEVVQAETTQPVQPALAEAAKAAVI